MTVAINLLAKGDVDARKRSVVFLVVPIHPTDLIAVHFVRTRRLHGVIGESNQIELRLIAIIECLRLSLNWWLVLRLLLRSRTGLSLTLGWVTLLRVALLRITLLVAIILLRGRGRRIPAVVAAIRIVAVIIGIVSIPIGAVIRRAVIIRVAAETKINSGTPVSAAVIVVTAAIVTTTDAAYNTDAATVESATDATSTKTSAAASVPPAASAMPATTTSPPVRRSDQAR